MDNTPQPWQPKDRGDGRLIFGLALAGLGILLILRMLHLIPSFHFSWPVVLIVVGFIIGAKHNFRNNAWWILMLIGAVFLLPHVDILGVPLRRLLWPLLLIVAGLVVIFRPRDSHRFQHWNHRRDMMILSNEADRVNIDVTFGGRKEVVTSRSFKGGVVRASFSGVELNLGAADGGPEPMVLEVYAAFAGVEIIVPSHWELQNEITPTLGSVEDHRMIRTDSGAEKRILILRGSCSFGSVEIKSY